MPVTRILVVAMRPLVAAVAAPAMAAVVIRLCWRICTARPTRDLMWSGGSGGPTG